MSDHTPPAKTITLLGSTARYWVFHPEQNQTIVIVHGFSGNRLGVLSVIAHLPGYRVIVPDLPGFGDSSPMREQPHTVAGYARFIEAFVRALKLPEPPVLAGHSFGTIVAARVASEAPKLISDRLVLMSPIARPAFKRIDSQSIGAFLGELHFLLGVTLGPVGTKLVKSRVVCDMKTFLLMSTKNSAVRKEIIAHHRGDLAFLRRKDIFYKAYRSMNRDGVICYAPRISQRTLIVAGGDDPVLPASARVELKRKLAQGELIILPRHSHLIHFEAPGQMAEAIAAFLRPEPAVAYESAPPSRRSPRTVR